MFSILELSEVLKVTKDRTKQILAEELANNPDLDVEKGRPWDIGPETVRMLYDKRGVELPQGRVIVGGIQKGGTGKTLTTTNIAGEAGRAGLKVLFIDADPENHATRFLAPDDFDRHKSKILYDAFNEDIPLSALIQKSKLRGVDFIPSGLRNFSFERAAKVPKNPKKVMRSKLVPLKEQYNVIVIDVGPAMSHLTSSCYLVADVIVMPVTPDQTSIESIGMTLQSLREISEEFDHTISDDQVKIIFNQTKQHYTTQDALAILLQHYKDKLITPYIKHSVEITKCNNARALVSDCRVDEIRTPMRYIAYQLIGLDFKEPANGKA